MDRSFNSSRAVGFVFIHLFFYLFEHGGFAFCQQLVPAFYRTIGVDIFTINEIENKLCRRIK